MMLPANPGGDAVLRVAVLDPGRSAAGEAALRRTRDIVDALCNRGVFVDWYVARDDPLEDHGAAHVRRLLPALAPASAALPRPLRPAAGPRRRTADRDVSGEPERARQEPGLTFWLPAIERADRWARRTWHHADAAVAPRLGALGVWALIRCFYQFRWSVHTGAWYLAAAARAGMCHVRWRVVHPAAQYGTTLARRFYWTILFRRVTEPAGRVAKQLRWRVAHPIGQRATSFARWLYWHGLFRLVIEPAAGLARRVRWRVAHPIGRGAAALARGLYWRLIFRFLVEPAADTARYLRWRVAHPAWQSAAASVRRLYWKALFPFVVEPLAGAIRTATWRLLDPLLQQARRRLGGRWRIRRVPRWQAIRRGQYVLTHGLRGLCQALRGCAAGRATPRTERDGQPWHGTFAAVGEEWRTRGVPHIVLLADARREHVEALFGLVPSLGLDAPLNVPLVALLDAQEPGADDILAGENDLRLRWRLGAPFRWLCPVTIATAPAKATGGPAAAQRSESRPKPADGAARDIAEAIIRIGRNPEGEASTSLVCERFGPLAIVLSALWGQVGSTAIFETQARLLLRRGFRIARVYVEHWPHRGPERASRLHQLIGADQARQRSHLTLVMERSERPIPARGLVRRAGFKPVSAVGRFAQALGSCTMPDRLTGEYVAGQAVVAVVNHAQHMIAARSLTGAPIILETHDVLTDLLDLHGIPAFVPRGRDSRQRRLSDERALWQQAECCINLSKADHAEIAPFARQVELIRPYRLPARATGRNWLEIIAANGAAGWSANTAACGNFDLMLWGSWHDNNIRSIRWFFDEVLPRLAGARWLRIVLAGAVVRGMGDLSQVACDLVTCPAVDALEDLAARTSVLVVADQGGTGISIKMMDALAWRACFAATPDAFRGLDISDRDNCASATAAMLADDIGRLLNCASARATRRAIARRIFDSNYSAATYEAGWHRMLDRLGLATVAPLPPARVARPATPRKAKARGRKRARAGIERPRLRLTVVVATCQRYDMLPDTLRALQAQSAAAVMEVIAVDHSPDVAAAARFWARYAGCPGLRCVFESAPGLSEARNAGLRLATGDIVAFVDDDAIARPNWARTLISAFETGGEALVAIGGRITLRWGQPRPPWLPDDLALSLVAAAPPGAIQALADPAWSAGCNIAFRRDQLLGIGGFAPIPGRGGSPLSALARGETELFDRLKRIGRHVSYEPRAMVEHVVKPGRLCQGWFFRRAAWQAVSDAVGQGDAATARARGPLPALARQGRGLPLLPFRECAAPDDFANEVRIAYGLVASLLAGGGDLATTSRTVAKPWNPPGPAPTRPAGRRVACRTAAEPRLSVVVATYERYRDLPRAVASLLAQDMPRECLEIIIVDNSPDGERARAFADRYAGVEGLTYLIEARAGLSHARNVGLERARAPITAFIDDDAVAAPDWARQIDRVFGLSGPRVAAVGGRVLPRFVSPRPAWLADELMGYLSIIDWKGGLRELARNEWIAGCNMAFRRDRLADAGGFPLELGRCGSGTVLLSNDESAVVARLRDDGHAVVYAPEASVEHVIDPARLDRAWFRRRAAWQAVSDCIQDGVRSAESLHAAAQHVKLAGRVGLPPVMRGRFEETVDPDIFRQEVALVYDMMRVALAGHVDGAPGTPGSRHGIADIAGEARAHMLAHPRIMRLGRRLREGYSIAQQGLTLSDRALPPG